MAKGGVAARGKVTPVRAADKRHDTACIIGSTIKVMCISNSILQKLTCASFYALDPCVSKLCVADISTFLEPSTVASATAAFAIPIGCATLGAYGNDGC